MSGRVDVVCINPFSIAGVASACLYKNEYPDVEIHVSPNYERLKAMNTRTIVFVNCATHDVRDLGMHKVYVIDDRQYMNFDYLPENPSLPRLPIYRRPGNRNAVTVVWQELYPGDEPMLLLDYIEKIEVDRSEDIRWFLMFHFTVNDMKKSIDIFRDFEDKFDEFANEGKRMKMISEALYKPRDTEYSNIKMCSIPEHLILYADQNPHEQLFLCPKNVHTFYVGYKALDSKMKDGKMIYKIDILQSPHCQILFSIGNVFFAEINREFFI